MNESRQLVCVRLLENDGERVRQLTLNDAGQYQINIWDRQGTGAFVQTASYKPKQNGQPMTKLPFVIVSTSEKTCPHPPHP